jgi:hypothetical protein
MIDKGGSLISFVSILRRCIVTKGDALSVNTNPCLPFPGMKVNALIAAGICHLAFCVLTILLIGCNSQVGISIVQGIAVYVITLLWVTYSKPEYLSLHGDYAAKRVGLIMTRGIKALSPRIPSLCPSVDRQPAMPMRGYNRKVSVSEIDEFTVLPLNFEWDGPREVNSWFSKLMPGNVWNGKTFNRTISFACLSSNRSGFTAAAFA